MNRSARINPAGHQRARPEPAHSYRVWAGDRGGSLSAFASVAVVALFLMAGLVVDGAAQNAERRRLEGVAAVAARAGVDAAAAERVQGSSGRAIAVRVAQQSLRDQATTGQVSLDADQRLVVSVQGRAQTILLSIAGITTLPASGEAVVVLRRR